MVRSCWNAAADDIGTTYLFGSPRTPIPVFVYEQMIDWNMTKQIKCDAGSNIVYIPLHSDIICICVVSTTYIVYKRGGDCVSVSQSVSLSLSQAFGQFDAEGDGVVEVETLLMALKNSNGANLKGELSHVIRQLQACSLTPGKGRDLFICLSQVHLI